MTVYVLLPTVSGCSGRLKNAIIPPVNMRKLHAIIANSNPYGSRDEMRRALTMLPIQ